MARYFDGLKSGVSKSEGDLVGLSLNNCNKFWQFEIWNLPSAIQRVARFEVADLARR
jgi:hypothetical protein